MSVPDPPCCRSEMTIHVSLVGYQKVVLAHDKLTPNIRPAATKIVENIPRHDHKVSYEHSGNTFHCMIEHEITYLCVTDVDTPVRVAYGFLEDIKGKFKEQFGTGGRYPNPAELNPMACGKFATTLAARSRFFNENPESDKIGRLKSQIDDVTQVMLRNIDDVIERGEKIDTLVDKTELLQNEAGQFHQNSRSLRRAMLCRNIKIMLAIILALCILALGLSWVICGITYKKCKSDDPPPAAPAATPTPATQTGSGSA